MTSVSQTGSASRHKKDHTVTQILSDSRSVRVVLYHSTPAESEHRFWIDPEVTYGGVAQALAGMYPSQGSVVLEANWGPRPYWTESHPESPVPSTCRVLYAILKDQAKPYTIGVVRTSLSDYPIPIYVPEPKSSMTILEAVIASYPKLKGHVKSIAHHSGDEDVQDDAWGDEVAEDQTYPEAPLFINTLDEPSKEFLSGSLYDAFSPSSPEASAASDSDEIIPPLLQISFAECKLLVRRAYELDEFPLQMIHLSEAIFHVVISLARSLTPVFENATSNIGDALSAEDDLADHLRIAPLLCRQLEEQLDDANGIMDNLEDGIFDREEAERATKTIFVALCGDLPGAVTVRCSEEAFEKLARIECGEFDALALDTLDVQIMKTEDYDLGMEDTRAVDLESMMDLDHDDVVNPPKWNPALDRWLPSDRTQVHHHHLPLVVSQSYQGPSAASHGAAPLHDNYGVPQPGPSTYTMSDHQTNPQHPPFWHTTTYPPPNPIPNLPRAGGANLGRSNSNSKQKQQGQRNEIDEGKLAGAFMPGSFRVDPVLRHFLDIIRTYDFYLEDRREPLLGTPEAEQIFAQVRARYPHDVRFTSRNDPRFASQTIDQGAEAQSIFITMTENNRCLICGQQMDRTGRPLGHVRSDIGHRPYHCTCEKCIQSANPRRFFSENLLDDHLKGQVVKQECVYCHGLFRRGGMRRHVASKHPEHAQETWGNDANDTE